MARGRVGLVVGTALVVPLLFLASASACVGGPILQVTPGQAAAGDEVTLTGISFSATLPLVVRFNALDGPVLGTFTINEDRALPASKVRIPAGTKPGNYVLIGTQVGATGSQAVVPTRALVVVTGPGGQPAVGPSVLGVQTGRPETLVTDSSEASTSALIMVGAGFFLVSLLVAGGVAYALGQSARPGGRGAAKVGTRA